MFLRYVINWIIAHPNTADFPKGKRAPLNDLISDVPRILPQTLVNYMNEALNCTLIQFLGKYPSLFYLDAAYVLFLPSSSFVDNISVSPDAQLNVVSGKVVSVHGKYGFAYGGKQDRIMFDIRAINHTHKMCYKAPNGWKDVQRVEDFCRNGDWLQCSVFPNQMKNGRAKWIALTCVKIDSDWVRSAGIFAPNNQQHSNPSAGIGPPSSFQQQNPGPSGLPGSAQNNNSSPVNYPTITRIRSVSMQSISECCNPRRAGNLNDMKNDNADLSMIGNVSMQTKSESKNLNSNNKNEDPNKNSPTGASTSIGSYQLLSPSMAKVAQMYSTQSIISDSVKSYQSKESELSELSGQQEAVDFIYRYLSKQENWSSSLDRLRLFLKRHGSPAVYRYINMRDPLRFIIKFPYVFQIVPDEGGNKIKGVRLTKNYQNSDSNDYYNSNNRNFSSDTTNGNPDISSINRSKRFTNGQLNNLGHLTTGYDLNSPADTRNESFDKDFLMDPPDNSIKNKTDDRVPYQPLNKNNNNNNHSRLSNSLVKPRSRHVEQIVENLKREEMDVGQVEDFEEPVKQIDRGPPSISKNLLTKENSSHSSAPSKSPYDMSLKKSVGPVKNQNKFQNLGQENKNGNLNKQILQNNKNQMSISQKINDQLNNYTNSIQNDGHNTSTQRDIHSLHSHNVQKPQLARVSSRSIESEAPLSSTGSNDRVCLIKILSEKHRMHVNWVWKSYIQYRDNVGNIKTIEELVEYLHINPEFEITTDGFVRLIDTDITPRNSDPNPNANNRTGLGNDAKSNFGGSAKTSDSYHSVRDIVNLVNRPTIGSQRKAMATLYRRSSTSMEMINVQQTRPSTQNPFLNPYGFADRTSYKFDPFAITGNYQSNEVANQGNSHNQGHFEPGKLKKVKSSPDLNDLQRNSLYRNVNDDSFSSGEIKQSIVSKITIKNSSPTEHRTSQMYFNHARNSLVYREMYAEYISSSPAEELSSNKDTSSSENKQSSQKLREPSTLFKINPKFGKTGRTDSSKENSNSKSKGLGTGTGTGNTTKTSANSHRDCSNASSSNKDIYGHFQSFPTSSCSSNDLTKNNTATTNTNENTNTTKSSTNNTGTTGGLSLFQQEIQHQSTSFISMDKEKMSAMNMTSKFAETRISSTIDRPNKLSVMTNASDMSHRCPAIDSYGQVSKDFDSSSQLHGQDLIQILQVLGPIAKILQLENSKNDPILSIALDLGRPITFRLYSLSQNNSPRSSTKTVKEVKKREENPERKFFNEKRRGHLKKIVGTTNITTNQLSNILNHKNVKQYDQGIYFVQKTLHIIRAVFSPMKILTSLTIFYQEHYDMNVYLNDKLYSWLDWLEMMSSSTEGSGVNESSRAAAAEQHDWSLTMKFITKSEIMDYLKKKDLTTLANRYSTSTLVPISQAASNHKKVNFNHPYCYYSILRSIANFFSSKRFEVVIVDIGGKICGIDPENSHRSVASSRRILSLETNNDMELKVVYQMVLDYNADVLILANLEQEIREQFIGRLRNHAGNIFNKMLILHE